MLASIARHSQIFVMDSLQVVASCGNVDAVRLLLAAGANANDGNPLRSPLYEAALRGHSLVVEELLTSGATIFRPGRLPNSLIAAWYSKSLEILGLLLRRLFGTDGLQPAVDDALRFVTRQYDEDLFLRLLCFTPPSSKYLCHACAFGSELGVRHLLDSGARADGGNGEAGHPLHTASLHLRPVIVRLLLSHGANANRGGKYGDPLLAALTGCAAPLLRRLRSKRAAALVAKLPPPPDRSSSVCYRDGELELSTMHVSLCEQVVRVLLDSGSGVKTGAKDLGTPLQIACFIGSKVLVKCILERGADVNAIGGYFETPLFAALEGKRTGIVDLLLDSGADVCHVHQDYGTPLYHACAKNILPSVRSLLSHGADPSTPNMNNETLVSVALKNERLEVLSVIQESKRTLRIQDKDILAAARLYEHPETLDLVLKLDEKMIPSEDTICSVLREPRPSLQSVRQLVARNQYLGVTEEMLKLAARAMVVRVLLEIRPICKLTLGIVEAQKEREAIELLLEHDLEFPITERVILSVLRAACSPSPTLTPEKDLLRVLWSRNPQLRVTRSMLEAASKYPRDLKFILGCNTAVPVPREVLCIAACHPYHASLLVRMLLAHDPSLRPQQDTARAAMARYPSDRVISTLDVLLEYNPGLKIPAIISSAASDPGRSIAWIGLRKQLNDVLRKYGKCELRK